MGHTYSTLYVLSSVLLVVCGDMVQIRFVRSTKYLKLEAFVAPTFTKFFSGRGCDTAGLVSKFRRPALSHL
jgi:hypothetical protein